MSMVDQVTFRLKKIEKFDWEQLTESQKKVFFGSIINFPLTGSEPNRFGFVKCQEMRDEGIFGYFTCESYGPRHRYNSKKVEEHYVDKPFEDLFVIVLARLGLCLIQNKKFPGLDLTMSKVYDKLDKAFEVVFKECDITYYGMDDLIAYVPKQKFIEIFDTCNVVSLKVGNLKGKAVPISFKIFNPHVEKNEIVRGMLDNSFKTVNTVKLEGTDAGGLQESKYHKAFLETGEPESLEFFDEKSNNKKILSKQIGPTLKLDIDAESPKVPDIEKEIDRHFSYSDLDFTNSKRKTVQTKVTTWDYDGR
ncbi:MAG: hypothetical protein JXA98_04605 [Methanosarcinaceae archaeon]|nr:hypothetical protein [Methanosarcinaceae archaeon]